MRKRIVLPLLDDDEGDDDTTTATTTTTDDGDDDDYDEYECEYGCGYEYEYGV